MRVLVIGTSGQLATELRRCDWPAGLERLPEEKVDLSQPEAVGAFLDRHRPELIMNAAAYTAVDRAETERAEAFAINATGPATLASWCARSGAALIHVSTDYVFDGAADRPYREQDATGPLGVYGASKLAGEQAVAQTLPRHVIVRTSWVFSAHGNNFVKTMLRLARDREELRVVADQHGRPTAAADLAEAVVHVAERIRAGLGTWGTFHFANAGATTWHAFAQAVVDEQAPRTGRRPRVVPITTAEYPTPARRPANSVLDTSRFEREFGLRPRDFRPALSKVVDELQRPSPPAKHPAVV